MPKEELVEGIKQALSRGENLERAMTTFYNAGYKKEEIEEAVMSYQSPGFFQQAQQPSTMTKPKPLAQQEQPKPIQPSCMQFLLLVDADPSLI